MSPCIWQTGRHSLNSRKALSRKIPFRVGQTISGNVSTIGWISPPRIPSRLKNHSFAYPQALLAGLGRAAPSEFWAAGPLQPLDQSKTGFFCSSQCPGSIVLKTFDAITQMRDEGLVLIGGFH